MKIELLEQSGNILEFSKNGTSDKKQTLGSFVLELLNDGIPKKSREILSALNKTRRKPLDLTGLSSRLYPYTKKTKTIKIYKIDSNPLENRFYYCKPEWFSGNELKPEYKSNIKSVLSELTINEK